jgi:hypothetical protein
MPAGRIGALVHIDAHVLGPAILNLCQHKLLSFIKTVNYSRHTGAQVYNLGHRPFRRPHIDLDVESPPFAHTFFQEFVFLVQIARRGEGYLFTPNI